MTKYAKTKDNKIIKIHLENGGVYTSKYELIGEPKDTIEELCDVFVITENKSIIEIFLKKDGWDFDKVKRQPRITSSEIKGAICTDKGLIYVAKMNSEGEFELI